MKINQTAGRCILACLLVFLLVQIYYLSCYLIPASPQEPWEELSVFYLVQSVFVTACICAVFFVQLWERVRRDAASPFARLLLVNGDGQVKKEVLLQGRYSFVITGKKNGRGAYICPSMDCFHLAIKQKGLERSFQMSIPPEFYTVFQKEMEDIGTE